MNTPPEGSWSDTERAGSRAETEPGSDGLIGVVLASRYRIEEKLGRGTTGSVYRASHVKFGRLFAVKVLDGTRAHDAKLVRRFDREAELGGKVRHTNVISVIDVGETPTGTRYMVMELASGASLARLLEDEAPFAAPRVLHLLRDLCKGLHHAHERGVIHRDFKPENIIIEIDDEGMEVPRIVDFGIAIARDEAEAPDSPDRLTTNGLVLGTPHYMAPEQATGFGLDHRIDLFALGVIAFEMLSGSLPFDGSGVEVARANILVPTPRIRDRVPGLVVDPLLEAFTARLMSKDPQGRPASANAARELLDLIERDRPAAAAALDVDLPELADAPAPAAIAAPVVRAELHDPDLDTDTDRIAAEPSTASARRWRALALVLVALALVAVVDQLATRSPPATPLTPALVPVAIAVAPADAAVAPALVAVDAAPVVAIVALDAAVVPGPVRPSPRPVVVAPRAPSDAGVAGADPSASEVAALYTAVGRELQHASTTHAPDTTEALSIRFRRIRLADALASPGSRHDAAGMLADIRRGIAALDQ